MQNVTIIDTFPKDMTAGLDLKKKNNCYMLIVENKIYDWYFCGKQNMLVSVNMWVSD